MRRHAMTDAERQAKRRENMAYGGYRQITTYLCAGAADRVRAVMRETGCTQQEVINALILGVTPAPK